MHIMLKIHVPKTVKICFTIISWILVYTQVTTNFLQNSKRQMKETSDFGYKCRLEAQQPLQMLHQAVAEERG